MRDNRIIRSRHLHKMQRRYFIVFDVLPFLGTLVALVLLFYRPVGALEISLFFGMWHITGLGLTVGYHRLFAHRAIGGLAAGGWWGALTGFLWGGIVRMFVVEQSMSAINSVMHTFGKRPFATRDDNSRNLGVMALLAWGDGWHNNHHAFPYSAAFGLRWFEFDPGFSRSGCLKRWASPGT
jgi:fatty-acid desaturase